MQRNSLVARTVAGVALGFAILLVVACQKASTPPPAGGSTGSTTQPSATDDAQSKIEQSLAQLSEKDRRLAEAQKTCPVSGEPLGSMGVPIKLTVEGQEVFICCEGCKEDLLNEPSKYLKPKNGDSGTSSGDGATTQP